MYIICLYVCNKHKCVYENIYICMYVRDQEQLVIEKYFSIMLCNLVNEKFIFAINFQSLLFVYIYNTVLIYTRNSCLQV